MSARTSVPAALFASFALVTLTRCGDAFDYTPPPNFEDPAIPSVLSGACGNLEVTPLDQLYAPGGPGAGATVAIEALPYVPMTCTRSGGDACPPYDGGDECCGCAFDDECTYVANDWSLGASICVYSADFACGFGDGCRPSCTPFSGEPRHRYRFIGTLRPATSPGLDVTAYCRVGT